MTSQISQPWTNILHAGLSFLDCSSKISRQDTIYQNSWQQTFYKCILLHWTKIGMEILLLCSVCRFFAHCSLLIEQLIDLRKVITENLTFKTDFPRLSCGWLVSNIVDDCVRRQIAKNHLKIKSWSSSDLVLPMLVAILLSNISFHL